MYCIMPSPNYNLKKIQNVFNRTARLIKGLSPRERITPALIELHWLPVKARIVFKMCLDVSGSKLREAWVPEECVEKFST